MATLDEYKERLKNYNPEEEKKSAVQTLIENYKGPDEYRAWRDWKGNVNLSNLTTGGAERYYQAYNHFGGADSNRGTLQDSALDDLRQSLGGALQGQGAKLKYAASFLPDALISPVFRDPNQEPEVGSLMWRMQQGAKADMGVANKLAEDSKYGRGKIGSLIMDLTAGGVDLASDALFAAATMGGSALLPMGVRAFGAGALEADEKGMSRSDQLLYGLKSAGIEVLTEKIGGPFERIYGKSALGGMTRNLANRLGQSAGMRFVLNRLGEFSGEAVEEMLSDVLNPLADKILRLDSGEGWEQLWTKEGMSQMAYDGLVGGLLGLFGGMAEGLPPQERARLVNDSIDNAMEASRQGRSIGAELEQDANGTVAQAISNTAPQSPVEAQSAPTQQVTPEDTQSAVKPEAGKFNAEAAPDVATPAEFTALDEAIDRGEVAEPTPSEEAFIEEPEAEAEPEPEAKPKGRQVGKKTGRQIAWDAWFGDNVRQDAEPEGVAVDASDFNDEASTGPEKSDTIKPEAKPKSGTEILTETKAEKAEEAPQKTDSKERKALIDRVRKRISEYESELSETKDKGNKAELKRLIEKDKQLLSRLENGEEVAPDSDAYKDEPTSDADSVKQSVLKKLKKDYSTVRNKLTESVRKLKNGSARKYSQPELDNLDIPISKRLDAANDYDKAQFMDAVDDYVRWWMKHDEIIDGQHMTDEEKLRLLPAKLETFIKNYESEHNYEWTADGNNIVKVYSTDVTGDVKKEEFELRYSDEQLAENARQTRLKHFLSYDLSTEQIADIIRPLIKPKLLTQHFNIGADGITGTPYSMNVSYPQTTDKKTGKKGPAIGGKYTAELYCTDAKTDTAVRVFKFKGKSEADVAKRAANIIRDFELGIQSGREALMKKTRGQISKELKKQFNARAKDGSDILANTAAPDYSGVYPIGKFTVSISKAIKEDRGRKLFDGWEVKTYIKKGDVDYVTSIVKTDPQDDIDPLQVAATLVHDANFDMGGYYQFSALKHKQGMPFEKAWSVTPKNGKSVVVDPSGNVHEVPVGATAIDDVNEVIGKQADPEEDVDTPWYKDITDEDILYSAKHPERVTVNGTDYDVRMDWTSEAKNNVEYVVTVAGEEDVEAHVGISAKREDWDAEDAVKFAIKHPKIWDSGYREGENWGERTQNEEEQSGDTSGEKQSGAEREAGEPALHDSGQGLPTVRASGQNAQGTVGDGRNLAGLKQAQNISQDISDYTKKHFGNSAYVVDDGSLNEGQKKATNFLKKLTGKGVYYVAHNGMPNRGGHCDADGNIYISAVNRTSYESGVATGIHETLHQRLLAIYSTISKVNEVGARIADDAFSKLDAKERYDLYFAYAKQYYANFYNKKANSRNEVARAFSTDNEFKNYVKHEALAAYVGGSTVLYGKSYEQIDKLQKVARNAVIKEKLFKKSDFTDSPLASDVYRLRKEAKNNGVSFYDEGADINETQDLEEGQAEAPPEDKAKSTFGDGYDNVQKSAEDFDKIKTRFDEDAFKESGKKQDKATRKKLSKLRELFNNAAKTGDVESLFSYYESLKDDPNLSNFYNEDVQEDIDNFRKLVDENLDTYNEGASPYAAARTMQKMAHKFAKANEYQQTLKKMNETLRGSKNGVLRKIGKSDKLTASVARALMRWQINPDTVFKMIDAFDKGNMGEGYKLAKELQTAHREKYKVLQQARTRFDEASKLDGYQDFIYGKQTVKDYSGREWDMRSALSVIKAIDTIRSTSGKKLGGTQGFGVMDSKGNIEYIDMSDVDAVKLYESLKSGLSDVATKFGDIANDAFNDVKEPLRKKFKDINGVDIQMIGDIDQRLGDKKGVEKAVYSPLSYVDKNGNTYQFDIAKQDTYNNIPRFLRERSDNGGTYLLIKPYTEVTNKYFEQVSNYLAYSEFNEKMRGLAKGSKYESGLGNTLAEVFGKDMGNWYQSYVEDLKAYSNDDDVEGVNSLLRQGRQRLQQGALLFSVSVPMKQISSYWAASGILHPDSLIQSYRIKLLKPKNGSDAATMLASRAMGNLEQSAAEAAKDAEKWLGKLKYSSKFIKMAANAINQMDYNTVSNLLTATEYDVLKYQFNNDTSKIGTEEFNQAVEELFQDVVDRSQPNFDKQMRAEYGRTDNEIVRMLSMFRTQQTQNLNLLATAIGEYQASKGTANQAKATETLKQTIAGQTASAFSLSMLTILADMLLHRQKKYEDEEEELDASKVLTRLGINAIEASSGTLWFGDTIAKWAIDRISGGKTKEFYGVNMGVISTVSDILENFENVMKNPTRSNIRYCAGNIATLLGVPLNNAYAMLNSAIMYGKDLLGSNEGDYDDILKYIDAQEKAAKKEEEKAAKEAAKQAEKSGADVLAETAKQNSSQSELNSQEATEKAPVSGYLTKPYNALVEAGMSSQRSQEVLTQMDTDSNNSVKQAEMIAYWKAHPEDEQYVIAMWNSYGYKTTWEKAKQKAG